MDYSDFDLRIEALRLAVNNNPTGSDEAQVASAEEYYKFLKGESA